MRILTRLFPQANPYKASLMVSQAEGITLNPPREFYVMLKAYYLNNGLYEELKTALYERAINQATISAIKNPSNRAVEFYAATLWPGIIDPDNTPDSALPLDLRGNDAILEPIQDVWGWSNWNAKKQLAARWLTMYGDLFIKVRQNDRGDRVYFQLIEPQRITDFKADDRGYLTFCRIDTPVFTAALNNSPALLATHVEVWDRDTQTVRIYEGAMTGTLTEALGKPTEEIPFAEFGIDFVPIVHAKNKDIGEERGLGCYTHVLDKIDEANIIAARLHQIVYRHNKPLWVLMAGGNDPYGRPLPAPNVGANAVDATQGVTGKFTFGEDDIVTLPGAQSLASLVPQLDFAGALDILKDQMDEIEDDLPEITFARLREFGANVSGRALKVTLKPALARALETRANAEAALIRANQMALTIGTAAGIFADMGTYEAGDYDHLFVKRPFLEDDDLEQAQAELAEAQAAQARVALGVSPQQALRELDYEDEQIEAFATEAAATPQGQAQAVSVARQRAALALDRGQTDLTGQGGGETFVQERIVQGLLGRSSSVSGQ